MPKIKDIAVARKDVFCIPPEHINVDPNWNVRIKTPEYYERIKELAASITVEGVKQPITLRAKKDGYWVTDGFCRMEAVKLAMKGGAKVKSVPCLLEERHSDEADHVFSMLIRNDQNPLTLFEKAKVAKRLLALGWTTKDIQEKMGKSPTYIANLVLLNSAHPETADLITKGKVSATLAIEHVRSEGPDKANETMKKLVAKAKSAGKGKATKKTAKPKSAVSWAKEGPALLNHINAICNGYGQLTNAMPSDFTDLLDKAAEHVNEVNAKLAKKD